MDGVFSLAADFSSFLNRPRAARDATAGFTLAAAMEAGPELCEAGAVHCRSGMTAYRQHRRRNFESCLL